ncbi:hypothetical protein M569_15588, partial [Genlisea aurea]
NHKSKALQKKRLSHDQVRLLEANFDAGRKLDTERKFSLARELGVPPRQIAVWYQNKRARWKNQSLELDYGALQLRLEAAVADKKELEKEVESLRSELRRAHEALYGFRSEYAATATAGAPPTAAVALVGSSLSSGGSSSMNDDVSENWANGETGGLQFEELYACLMLGASKGRN